MSYSFCPCFGSRPRIDGGTYNSYVRVVNISPPPYSESPLRREPTAHMPNGYHTAEARIRESTSLEPLIIFDEKEVTARERPLSSRSSSIISIPFTHATSLTSNPTGSTVVRGSLERGDSYSSTAPPSYRSERNPSPSPPPSDHHRHPVMTSEWLRNLQQRANETARQPNPS